MSTSLAPFIRFREVDANGNPLVGGKLYTYQAGTATPQATYTSSTGGTANANPVILDASGRAQVWLDQSLSYKFVLKDSLDNTIWTEDNVIGLLAVDAVNTAAIQALSVTTAKMADNSVTALKLASDAAIDANRSVTTNHIRDLAITNGKLDGTTTSSGIDLRNLSIVASVATNVLTAALKTKAGSANPSAADPITIGFRSSSLTSGLYVTRSVSAALSIATPASGATFGATSAVPYYIYLYAIDNAGTVELAFAGSNSFDESLLYNTTILSAASTSKTVLYSAVARTGVAIRLLGRIRITEATAGTYASSPTEVSVIPFARPLVSRDEILLNGYAGHGSTNTKILRYTTVTTNIGTSMTLAQSATLGDQVTINESGIYALTMQVGAWEANNEMAGGASVDSSQLTTNIGGITTANKLAYVSYSIGAVLTAGASMVVSWFGRLEAGQIVRPHDNGNVPTDATVHSFKLVKIS